MVNPIDKQIGANLARIRLMRGFSRATLGECLSDAISQQAIAKYESGITRIPSSSLAEFAVMLECNVSDLFAGVDEILREGVEVKDLVIDRKDENLLKDYRNIKSPALQAAIRNMTRALVLELTHNFTRIS